MGREAGGYWKGFDFVDDTSGMISSLKTLDPRLPSYVADGGYSKITNYIDDLKRLGEVTIANGKIVAKKLLDIRVPVGTRGKINIARIEEYASQCGIQVIIKEF